MKKIITILVLLICMSSLVSAVSLEYEQTSVITDYNTNEVGASLQRVVVGSSNSVTIGNKTGDIKFELRGMSQPYYLLIDNGFINNTFNITYVNDDPIKTGESGKNATTQELTMQELGMYYFKIEPSYEGESVDFILNFDDDRTTQVFLQEQHPQGFNTLMAGFVNAFLDIVEINITMWRIAFYVLIFIILIGFVALVFGGSFYIFKVSQNVKDKKEFFEGRE